MEHVSRRGVLVAACGTAASAVVASGGAALISTQSTSSARREVGTSFGSVTLLASSRLGLSPAAGAHQASHRPGRPRQGHGRGPSEAPLPSIVHGAWKEAVVVDLEVRNDLSRPIELSPGQFRMRVESGGPTVSLYSSDRDAGPLRSGAGTTMRVTYLAPPADQRLSLEFSDPAAVTPVRLGHVGRRLEGELA